MTGPTSLGNGCHTKNNAKMELVYSVAQKTLPTFTKDLIHFSVEIDYWVYWSN